MTFVIGRAVAWTQRLLEIGSRDLVYLVTGLHIECEEKGGIKNDSDFESHKPGYLLRWEGLGTE